MGPQMFSIKLFLHDTKTPDWLRPLRRWCRPFRLQMSREKKTKCCIYSHPWPCQNDLTWGIHLWIPEIINTLWNSSWSLWNRLCCTLGSADWMLRCSWALLHNVFLCRERVPQSSGGHFCSVTNTVALHPLLNRFFLYIYFFKRKMSYLLKSQTKFLIAAGISFIRVLGLIFPGTPWRLCLLLH